MLIAYCGNLWEGSTAKMRLEALQRLGHTVIGVDTTRPLGGVRGIWVRAAQKAGWTIDAAGANRALLGLAKHHRLEVVWIDKGVTIQPGTLRIVRETVPGVRLVHYSLDDMSVKHNQSRQYLAGVSLYDLHVTNNSYNVAELHSMGATSVLFVNNAFCPTLHRPVVVSSEDRERLGGPVGFIGAFERERADAIWFLVTSGIPVRVWGETWGRGWMEWAASRRHPGLKVERRALFGPEYAMAICSFDINLAFLARRLLCRDLQTTRSVEIPACGAFMLAPRTTEHQQLFREGVEADFFSTHDELLNKCQYYLAHSEARSQIARAGLERCKRSDYSYDRQLHDVLNHLDAARCGPRSTSPPTTRV